MAAEVLIDSNMQVVIELKNGEPVELLDFANSMLGAGNQYAHYLERFGLASAVPDAKLYIKEIRQGSIVATLGALASVAIPLIEQYNVVHDFANHLKTVASVLLGRDKSEAQKLDAVTLRNVSKFVEPVAKDAAAQLNVGTIENHGVINVFSLNSTEANAIQNRAKMLLQWDSKSQVQAGEHQEVAMYWARATNSEKNATTDRATIESIYPKPVKVRFASAELKKHMLLDVSHPFSKAFIVNVKVETVEEKPVLYYVTELLEVLDK
ncbi:hypothetical protein AXYL_04034 [Achromobacter xylosoxidans A8]|uniref:Uncharacterized protein n=1 Tax=Achromobacter xylosoxidans (strain A8) TaxID=762376 RepID=E3HSN7_ACHXA|nr:hypothetical protein [Achromobacter xylosoxidans]ADP17354.1 hypothetical protein AXYL_04034 [Achromobacter xylosoxidans A8]